MVLVADVAVDIQVEYLAGVGDSQIQLRWETPLSLNELIPAARLSPSARVSSEGVLRESWDGVTGSEIGHLLNHAAYADNFPGSAATSPSFEYQTLLTQGTAIRTRARLTAPQTGYYRFQLSASSLAELRVGNGLTARNAAAVASVASGSGFRQFDVEPNQTSQPVFLMEGEAYYIELLQLSHGVTPTDAHASVSWTRPDLVSELIPTARLQTVRPVDRADRLRRADLPRRRTDGIRTANDRACCDRSLDVRLSAGRRPASEIHLRGSALASADVHFLVVEEGVYTQADDGVTMEAHLVNSTVTDRKGRWKGVDVTSQLTHSYSAPVVVGQVMSYENAKWSTFWSRGRNRTKGVQSTHIVIGKHVGEDPDQQRGPETIGFVVLESGKGTLDGVPFLAAVGADTIDGLAANGETYALSDLVNPTVAVASQTGMDGNDGSWSVLNGANALDGNSLRLAVDEDQSRDHERGHVSEQVAYWVFGEPTTTVNSAPDARDDAYSLHQDSHLSVVAIKGVIANDSDADGDPLMADGPKLVSGLAANLSNARWTVVDVGQSYQSMVVVDEDQARDSERSHVDEQVAYLVFGSPPAANLRQPVVDRRDIGASLDRDALGMRGGIHRQGAAHSLDRFYADLEADWI